jgi:hypothetical protein
MNYGNVEDFATELTDDDRTSFSFEEASEAADDLGLHVSQVIRELKSYGFSYEGRAKERRIRGFTTSSHDRWFGPGASPTHGGSGWEQINGFSGQVG